MGCQAGESMEVNNIIFFEEIRMRRFIIGLGISITLIFAVTGSSWAKAKYVMKLASTTSVKPGWNYQWTYYDVFKAEVEKRTQGEVEVKYFPSGQLGGIEQLVIQTRQGMIQACDPEMGHYATLYPNIQVFSIPYLFVDRLVAWNVIHGQTAKDMIEDMAKTVGVRPLIFNENSGFRNFTNSKRPIREVSDMKGMKIRTMNIPLHMQIVKDLGASPTPIAWTELYSALQLKVVDGQENAVSTFRIPKLEEVQKYMILDGHVYSVTTIMVNEKWWQSLPARHRAAINQSAQVADVIRTAMCYLSESKDVKELTELGVEIYEPTVEQKRGFQKATQASAINWLRSQKNIDSKWVDKLLQEVRDVENRLGYND